MIERLLAAFAEGAEDGAAPRTAVGAEEIADILWLAARVDPAAARTRTPAPASDDASASPPAPAPPDAAPGPVPAPGADAAQLFPATARPGPAAGPPGGRRGRRGVPLRLPRTASLDDPLGLMRSLRPVGRRSIGGPGEELDEQLTVERSIEAMVPTPVLRPSESRWLDLALVVDSHPSMLLWADLVAELRGVLTRSGVFRDVRAWQLTGTGRGGTPRLARGPGTAPRNPLELADPAGRRLILVVSDTVAGGWQEGPLRAVLRHWSSHNAVAVLNVLPERLWTRGAVRPVPFAVRSDRPAAATRSWQRVPAARRARGGGPVVPVVGLASGSLARLVRVVSGDGRWRRLACLRLDAAAPPPPRPAGPPRRAADPMELVERFRAGASPTAQQLAAHLAAVPLTLPVMTLVRRSLLRGSEHGHLAEVALGGLFAPWDAQQRPEEAEFEFLPGVRDVLLGSQLRGDVAAVRELVRRRVWEFMSRHRGTGPDFSATRVTTGQEGRRLVPDEALPFAERGADGPADGKRGPDGAAVGGDPDPGEEQAGGKPDPGQEQAGGRREPAGRGAASDGGPASRVVRVRFEPLAEPAAVGTLLAPRLVLTVGDVPRPGEALAWIRSGGREVPCRPVWWDNASPPVLLLESEEDLAGDAEFAPQLWGTRPAGAEARLRVDGVTDGGLPAPLTGSLVRDGGAANGELVRLSAEPEGWTHFVGAPVSYEGWLLGVVHTVRPDRLVFLSGAALLDQVAFRSVLDSHPRASGYRTGFQGPWVTVGVRMGGAAPRGGRGEPGLRRLLSRLTADASVDAELGEGPPGPDPRTAYLLLDPPGSLGQGGRLLAALPGVLAADAQRVPEGTQPAFAVVLGTRNAGTLPGDTEGLLLHDLVTAHLGEAGPGHGARLLLALTRPLYEELGRLLGPAALRDLVPLGAEGDAGGWAYRGSPGQLAELLTEAEESTRGAAVAWLRCRAGSSDDEPRGCPGIRLAGRHACLAHLPPGEQEEVLAALAPGAPLDFRGVPFGPGLLRRVLDAVREPGTRRLALGAVTFEDARFEEGWEEAETVFTAEADFSRAVFEGPADFTRAAFRGRASFEGSSFHGDARFTIAEFGGPADFRRAVFTGRADFEGATWAADVSFRRALLRWGASLAGASVDGAFDFRDAACQGPTDFSRAFFAGQVSCEHAVWEGELWVSGVRFLAPAAFDLAVCRGQALFRETSFEARTSFAGARFEGGAEFTDTDFARPVDFARVLFTGEARWEKVGCLDGASFDRAVFSGPLHCADMTVGGAGADFTGARFQGSVHFLRATFATDTGFDGASFDGTVSVEDSVFRAGPAFPGAAFHGRAEFTGVELTGPPSLPDGWAANRSDAGLWHITSPHPAHPPEGSSPDGR
ncbi:pentapeptide repeat-containing protein [Streptomyces racemochromogenes]|uniref:Pentapeptide repeat-containing protein n=1 Tax=Streptomyces racemochromogenes TaxID=67353 RepID=A0ABW7P7C0_9ACTN